MVLSARAPCPLWLTWSCRDIEQRDPALVILSAHNKASRAAKGPWGSPRPLPAAAATTEGCSAIDRCVHALLCPHATSSVIDFHRSASLAVPHACCSRARTRGWAVWPSSSLSTAIGHEQSYGRPDQIAGSQHQVAVQLSSVCLNRPSACLATRHWYNHGLFN